MNTYENMLRQGMSMDEIMNEVRTQITNAQAQIKAEEEAKRKADNETMAKALVDICNRIMESKLTAADVAYIYQLYAKQQYPEHARIFAQMFNADDVDSTIKMAIDAMDALTPLVHMVGAKDWNEVLDGLTAKEDKSTPAHKNDDVILRDFINSIKG